MKTIVFANQKGGVGKTAVLVQLAYYFSISLKLRVLVLDLDHQRNTTKAIMTGKLGVASSGIHVRPPATYAADALPAVRVRFDQDGNIYPRDTSVVDWPARKNTFSDLFKPLCRRGDRNAQAGRSKSMVEARKTGVTAKGMPKARQAQKTVPLGRKYRIRRAWKRVLASLPA